MSGTIRLKGTTSGHVDLTVPDSGPNVSINAAFIISKDSANGTIQNLTTREVAENANFLYYTDARVDSAIDGRFVSLSGDETIAGEKTFSGQVIASSDVGVGTSDPDSKLHVSGGINTGPATAGSTDAALIVSNADDAYGIHMNVSASSGAGFISAQRNDGTATGYNLVLQPNAGNVGIGTDSPASALHVDGDYVSVTNGTEFGYLQNVSGSFQVGTSGSSTAPHLSFATLGTERMRIDSAGNLGIGTATPSAKLQVAGPSNAGAPTNTIAPAIMLDGGNTGAGEGGELRFTAFGRDNGLAAIKGYVLDASANSVGNLDFYTRTDNTQTSMALAMRISYLGDVGIGVQPVNSANYKTLDIRSTNGGQILLGRPSNLDFFAYSTSTKSTIGSGTSQDLSFNTNSTGSNNERMRITADGNILFAKNALDVSTAGTEIRPAAGVYSSINSSNNSYHVYNTTSPAFTFYVSAAGTINAVNTTISALSDERLKENVRDLDDGLSKIMQLQPRKFDWKEGKGRDISDDRGFIAQEFETVFPDMVQSDGLNTDSDGESYKTVCANLVPTLVKSIQEQQAIIESLETRIQQLENN